MMKILVRLLFVLIANFIVIHVALSAPTSPTSDFTDLGDGTVTHKPTGLQWMRCSIGQTWSGSTCAGSADQLTWTQAMALQTSFAGHSDWRLPSVRELQTILEYENFPNYTPAVNLSVFPNTMGFFYWTSTPVEGRADNAWFVHFYTAIVGSLGTNNGARVRLVRGGESSHLLELARPSANYVDNADGTVTHTPTHLQWMRCSLGQTWDSGGFCTGAAQRYTFDQTKNVASTFAGYNDWRLPTISELLSLADYTRSNLAINPTIFPNTPSGYFWSASPLIAQSDANIWFGTSDYGEAAYGSAAAHNDYIRLVRNAPSPVSLTSLSLVCPASLDAGAQGVCTATAGYSDGSGKAVDALWSSSNEAALAVDGSGNLTAGVPASDTSVILTASYAEGGVSQTAAATVTIKAQGGVSPSALLLDCPPNLLSGLGGLCSASVRYSDGSRKAASPVWTSSAPGILAVDANGNLTAGNVAQDTAVSIGASYTEAGKTLTATASVIVLADTGVAGGCTGTKRNMAAISILGNATKSLSLGDSLDVVYCLKNFNQATRFDIYVAVQIPDGTMLFLQSDGFFQTPTFTSNPLPYLTNTLIPDKEGSIMSMPVLPLSLPTGTYYFYAISVLAGKDVMVFTNWIGDLSKTQLNLIF